MMARLETQLKQIWRTLSGEDLSKANALLPSISKGRSVSLPHRIHLHQIFEELIISNNNETETAREVAIWQNDESLTFTELNQRANVLARVLSKMLRDHGSELEKQEDSVVGIFMPSSPNRIAIQLACLKLGLAYLPLDLELSNAKIESVVHDVQPICVLIAESYYKCRESLLDRIGNHCLIFFEDLYKTAIERQTKARNLEPEESFFVSNDPLAIVIYSRGDAMLSKGIKIHHSNIYNRLLWQWDKIVYQEHDIVCCKSSFLSVTAHCELFACLLRGIPIVLTAPNVVGDINIFSKEISERYITWIFLVPSQLRQWLNTLKENPDLVSRMLSLQTVIITGEVLSPFLANLFFSMFPSGKRLINVYGTSEVCGYVLSQMYNNSEDVCENTDSDYLSVGRPMYNTDVYIVNDKLQPVETNSDGEVSLSGFTVSKGYWDRNPKPGKRSVRESRRSFSENLTQPRRGYSQQHCTGDIGFMKDGQVFIKGRIENRIQFDDCVFDAGKVDNIVWMHPCIESCSSIGLTLTNNKKCVVTFYTVKASTKVNIPELQTLCSEQLPLYIKPEFVQISEMPVSPVSLRIDQQKLKQFYLEYIAIPNSKTSRQECPTSDNARIRAVIAEFLHLTPREVLDTDDFFGKGGNPTSAADCVKKLKFLGFHTTIRSFMSISCIGPVLPMIKHGIIAENKLDHADVSYKICEIQDSDVDVTYFLAENLLDHDVLVKSFQISYEDLANFIEDNRTLAISSGMSLVARKTEDDTILGVAFVYRWEETPMPSGSDELEYMGEYMRVCGTGHDEVDMIDREGPWLQLFLCCTSWAVAGGRLALEISHKLETTVLSMARDHNFTAIETISTSVTDKTIREELGYKTVAESSLDQFLQDNDLPSSFETGSITSNLMIHRLDKPV